MTKNPSTLLQGSKSPWLPSLKANKFIDLDTNMLRCKYNETKLFKKSIA